MTLHHRRLRRARRSAVLALLLALVALLRTPPSVSAHPLDVYVLASYVTVTPAQIMLELDLSPGVLVAPAVLPQLDPSGDAQISAAEGRAYVDGVLPHVALTVDGTPLVLAVTAVTVPSFLAVQAGYGTIRIMATASTPALAPGPHHLVYTNAFAATGAAYQVNVVLASDPADAVVLGKPQRDATQQRLTLDYTIAGAVPAAAADPAAGPADAVTTAPAATTGPAQRLLGYLYEPIRSPWMLALALAVALVLGGLHALTPGHGKTLVAAYLVGSRGTVRHAVTLGTIVTITHTASVLGIGLLALLASQVLVPGVLVPSLEILSGLLVVGMGSRLVWQRWWAVRRPPADHAAAHAHPDALTAPLVHDHGDGRSHTHLPPTEGVQMRNLVALGVSGGLVPCPEALGIMILAIGLNRIGLGLGLIIAFSVGLAAVLIGIGILLVRSRRLLDRLGGLGSRWSRALPLGSAVLVTVLGIGITLRGLASMLG